MNIHAYMYIPMCTVVGSQKNGSCNKIIFII